ncbi:MAG: cation diffusion facilitator family transporter [Pseudomonadota bacterium]
MSAQRNARITRLAQASIAVGLCVLALKGLAFALTGSIAILSDALETVVNVAAAVLALWAVRFAARPADSNHPHGHEKAEFLAAVIEGTLVLVAALLIAREAITGLMDPQPITADPVGLGVLALATVVNLIWARVLIREGRALRSPALEADGVHLRADVFTSLAVFAGVGLTIATGLPWLDPAIALCFAVHVLWSGWSLARANLGGLMDETVDAGDLAEIEAIVTAHLGDAIEAHDLKVRPLGRGLAVEMHLVVPGDMTVAEAHDICDVIEDALDRAVHGGDVIIHLEPPEKAKDLDRVAFQTP